MLSSFAFPEPQLKTTATDVHKKKNNSKNTKSNNGDTASVHELTDLIGRLTTQLAKLETIKSEKKLPTSSSSSSNSVGQQQRQQHQRAPTDNSKRIIINPLAADVTQAYEKLIQQNEHLQSSSSSSLAHNSHNNNNHCCCSCSPTPPESLNEETITVEAAPGIPWFSPYTVTSTTSNGILSNRSNTSNFINYANEDPLQAAYTHWCTLMRCLPAMDPDAQSYVRTIGHYAMRQLLHSMRNNSNNNNSYNSSASATATRRYSSLMSSSPIQRHSHYHGSSATLLSNKTAGIASSHAGSSNAGSTTLAQHPLLKTSSTCLNDVHPTTHYSLPQESATLCKADAWVPPRMIDDTSAPLRPHQHHNRYHNHHCQSNNTCQQQHNNNHHSQPQPLPQQQHQQQGHPYPRMIQQQQRQEDQDGRTPPVANSGSSPLPTSSSLFSSPLMQHISRPYHAAKLRRWFKKHNKVAPVDGQH